MSLPNKLFFLVKTEKEDFTSTRKISRKKSYNLANFLVIYFDWTFFLFISPYRFVRNKNKIGFRSWKFYPQILISGILNVLWLNYSITTCRKVANGAGGTHTSTGPSAYRYFLVLSFISAFIFQGLTLKLIWFNKNGFNTILNFMENERLTSNWIICSKPFIHFVCLLVTMLALFEPMLQLLPQSFVSSSVALSMFNVKSVSESRYSFFITNYTQKSRVLNIEEMTKLDYFLCVMYYLGHVQSFTFDVYPPLLVLFGIFTVWLTTKQFSGEIRKEIQASLYFYPIESEKKCKRLTWPEIYEGYKVIRQLCEIVNEAFGSILSTYLGSCLLFQATGLDAVLAYPSITLKIRLLFIIILSAVTFVLAADICEKMSAVKLWLAKDENRRNVPKDHLNIILGQLAARDVGIRGSNIFTITYPLLWSVITTVITYFIICLQARKEK